MRARTARSAAAAGLLTAISVAGCASSDDNAASEPATKTVTVEVTRTNEATPRSPDTATPPAPTTHRTTAQDDSVGAGQRCDLGKDATVGLVVKGTMTCGDLRDVWKRAVADPAFAHHGNHNRIVVGDWTCRAHQTRPVQTGFCAKDSYRVKFKVIHR